MTSSLSHAWLIKWMERRLPSDRFSQALTVSRITCLFPSKISCKGVTKDETKKKIEERWHIDNSQAYFPENNTANAQSSINGYLLKRQETDGFLEVTFDGFFLLGQAVINLTVHFPYRRRIDYWQLLHGRRLTLEPWQWNRRSYVDSVTALPSAFSWLSDRRWRENQFLCCVSGDDRKVVNYLWNVFEATACRLSIPVLEVVKKEMIVGRARRHDEEEDDDRRLRTVPATATNLFLQEMTVAA